ncbi:hypothetical protein B0T19DRAFT_416281 [Cercophora scortea]|uniref:RING-type domain-containing protein n=1 Tax=Cercophora scortea TaxID=314031 RepID=A0AAE0IX37_9PEZI|nr:hypothetical protein B0T19DRAFT_416281 [Cercophora scortea]
MSGEEEEEEECSICMDVFEDVDDVRVFPCGHIFHQACIDPWLLFQSTTCPDW